MAVLGARVTFAIGAGGRPLLGSGGHNGTARIWHPHAGDAVEKPLIEHLQHSELTQAPRHAALTDSGRSSGGNVSSMQVGPAHSRWAISQFNNVNVSDTGMPT